MKVENPGYEEPGLFYAGVYEMQSARNRFRLIPGGSMLFGRRSKLTINPDLLESFLLRALSARFPVFGSEF